MALQKVLDSMRTTTALDSTKLSGAVPTAALSNVDLVEGTKGADIASAGTMVIGTDGGYFDITGTTGISTMTVAAGRMFTLQFDGAVVLTNSSTLKLSGAANFTTAAGDHLTFVSVAANDVRQVGFGLTDGGSPVAAAGGSDTSLSNLSATGKNKIAQAWVNFNGDTFGVRDSFNVSSVTDNGTGEYVVNIDTDFPNVNYVTVASCICRVDDNYGIIASINSHSTSDLVRSLPATVGATGILTFDPRANIPRDSLDVMAVCFGD